MVQLQSIVRVASKKNPTNSFALTAMAALAFLSACASSEPESLEIRFAAQVGEQPARCNVRFEGVGTGGGPVEVADARLYISELELGREDGTWVPLVLDQESPWQHENVALLDFEDASGRCSETGTSQMNSVIRATAPADSYTTLRFEVGVPHALNHLDAATAPSPLNLNAMYWNWRLGYIFTKIEFWNPGVDSVTGDSPAQPSEKAEPEAEEDVAKSEPLKGASGAARTASNGLPMPPPGPTITYLAHFGSTGCKSPAITSPPEEPCSRPNRVAVTLDDFDPQRDTVGLDLASLVKGIDVAMSTPRPPGCMSGPHDPDCRHVFANLGLDIETGRCRTDCSEQELAFRIAAEGDG